MKAAQAQLSMRWSADPDHLLKTLGPPRASVIIPHFNTPELLVKCLQSVAAQTLNYGWFEIIVVDNGSRLPMRLLEATWPGVRFLIERQPGPGPARNTGVRAARADILAFVDADVRVAPGWLKAGLKAVGRNPLALFGGDVRIDAKEYSVQVLEHRDLRAEAQPHGTKLHSNVAPPITTRCRGTES